SGRAGASRPPGDGVPPSPSRPHPAVASRRPPSPGRGGTAPLASGRASAPPSPHDQAAADPEAPTDPDRGRDPGGPRARLSRHPPAGPAAPDLPDGHPRRRGGGAQLPMEAPRRHLAPPGRGGDRRRGRPLLQPPRL